MKPVQPAQNAGSSISSSSSGSGYVLQPGAPPGHSALWLATSKKIEVPANGFVFWVEIIAVGMMPMMRIIAIGMICYLSMRRTVGMI